MNNDFEPVMAALFDHLVTVTAGVVKTHGRRVLHWTDVPNQPALFLRRVGVNDEASGHYEKTTLDCEIWLYANDGKNPAAVPDMGLTDLEKLVRGAFDWDSDNAFTLGGLVHWCRIEGHSDISPGDQGEQAIARIPVRILLP